MTLRKYHTIKHSYIPTVYVLTSIYILQLPHNDSLMQYFSWFTKIWICFVIVICSAASCKKDLSNDVASSAPELVSVVFNTQNNPKQLSNSISCSLSEDTASGYYPLNTDASTLVASLTLNESGVSVKVNGEDISDINAVKADFSKPVKIDLTADSITESYTVNLAHFTGLPIVYINTNGNQSITSKIDSVVGTVSIDSNTTHFASYTGSAYYFVHGNTTAGFPKLPYKMILDSKSPLLGMPTATNWILLANYDDKTLLRNYLAFQLGHMFEMQWTPSSQFVEVVLNGSYIGNYQLTEEVEQDKSRLDIHKMSTSDETGDDLTGGYLLEADNKLEDDDHVRFATTSQNNSLVVHSPSKITTDQLAYISNYVSTAENALYGSSFIDLANGYRKYINPTSFVDYFLVNEFSRNNDADFWSSTYMFKDKDSLLNIGPIWDFDIAFGNTSYNGNNLNTGWYMATTGTWFSRLLQDPYFKNLTIARWKQMRTNLDSLDIMVDAMSNNLNESQKQNFTIWPILNTIIQGAAPVAYGSYDGEINNLKQWIDGRLAWMDANINSL